MRLRAGVMALVIGLSGAGPVLGDDKEARILDFIRDHRLDTNFQNVLGRTISATSATQTILLRCGVARSEQIFSQAMAETWDKIGPDWRAALAAAYGPHLDPAVMDALDAEPAETRQTAVYQALARPAITADVKAALMPMVAPAGEMIIAHATDQMQSGGGCD